MAVKIGEPVSNLQRTLTNGTNGEERSLPDLWVTWEQDGRHFWQAMDELVEMLGGLVEGQQ